MQDSIRILTLFGGIFFLLTLILNFLVRQFPRIPGDVDIRQPNFSFYLPFTSSIILTVLITLLFKYFFR
ncbi:MAG TPA: DUF2905 domain-containing protein [Patescibacteria group bacterium]|nr:DUF2905 domain-containing protein [Patescibacteria group bacterium]